MAVVVVRMFAAEKNAFSFCFNPVPEGLADSLPNGQKRNYASHVDSFVSLYLRTELGDGEIHS